jgi:hypothetical protein
MATNFSSFLNGFMGGMNMVRQVKGQFDEIKDARDIRSVADAKPEESKGFTAEQGEELQRAADSGQYDIGYDEGKGAYTVTPKADPTQTGVIAQQGVTDFLGKRTAGSMTADQMDRARQNAMADVVGRRNPAEAMRMRREVKQAEREDVRFGREEEKAKAESDAREKKAADEKELSTALRPVPAEGGDEDAQATQRYLTHSAPKVVNILVKQGRFDDAKKYQEFVDSEQGREYASKWVNGMRALSFGDTTGAAKQFESLYNSQHFNDGNTATFTPMKGKSDAFRIDVVDASGNVVGSQEGSAQDLLSKAALFLDPVKAVTFLANEGSKKASAQATADRMVELEMLRQRGRTVVEDRKYSRQASRLAIRNGVNGPSAPGGAKGPTVSQARSNAEIEAARKVVSQLRPDEISKRTQPRNKYGFPNPDYDPELARQAKLAARRKYGTDDDFDKPGTSAPAAASRTSADAADRFKTDKAMSGSRLGAQTARGYEVFDRSGKLIGYYR